MLIQVDVDSTLYDADKLFNQLFKEAGFDWIRNSPSWFGPEMIGCTRQDMKNLFRKAHSREYVMQQKPYPNAVKVLTGLVEDYDDVELAFVSDRNESQTAALRDWLIDTGFLPETGDGRGATDTFVAATKDKRDWMREKRPSIVIDDRVRTMLMARFELGSYVVSLEHAHNRNLINEADHIYIVKDWNEIDRVLRETVIPKVQEKSLTRTNELSYTR